MLDNILNTVSQGNCLELMQKLPDKSVDMVLVDLPYCVTNRQEYDLPIDLKLLWEQYIRVIKDSGVLVFTATEPFRTKLIVSKMDWFKYDLIWEKNKCSGFLNAKKQPLRQHESILIFYKKQPTYLPQKTSGHKPVNKFVQKGKLSKNYGQMQLVSGGGSTERYPTSIIKIPVVDNCSVDRFHPAQKPVALGEYLIKTYSKEGELILDNCCGSGSFLVAAKNLNRKFIGMDLDQNYVNVSKQRLGI